MPGLASTRVDLYKMRAETPCLCANTSHISLPDWRLCWKFAYGHHFPPEVTITVQFDRCVFCLTHHCKMAVEESTDKLCAGDRKGTHLKRLPCLRLFFTITTFSLNLISTYMLETFICFLDALASLELGLSFTYSLRNDFWIYKLSDIKTLNYDFSV